jgi:glycosyltransferase involved in cell wall biosynthesis
MKIVSFVEGARQVAGKPAYSIPSTGEVCALLADRGHSVWVAAGGAISGPGDYVAVGPEAAVVNAKRSGGLDACVYRSVGNWSFAPGMVPRCRETVRECDFVMLHSLYSFPVWLGAALASRYHKPYAIWPHGVLSPFQRSISRKKKWIYDRTVGRSILDGASVVVYTALGEWQGARELGMTTPSAIIPLGFEPRHYDRLPPRGAFRAKWLSAHRGPLVLFLGRLNAKKGLELLIQAMSHVVARKPETMLAIVGPSDPPHYKNRLLSQIRACNLESHIVLTGPVTALEHKRQAFADADVFSLPSACENFGFAMFEAMSSAVPVVVSDLLDYAEEVRQYGAGLVVRRDPNELAAGILRVLEDGELRDRLGKNGIRLAHAYSWDSCVEKVERVMRSILLGQPIPEDLVPNDQSV